MGFARFFFYVGSMETGTERALIIGQVTGLVEPILAEMGLELVEVQFRNERNGLVLRIMIFRPEGVTLDDCSRASREISHILEVEDPIASPFNLEVSSPGLDRPLKSERDFRRYLGSEVQVQGKPESYIQACSGTIVEVRDGLVVLDLPKERKEILLAEIAKATLVIKF